MQFPTALTPVLFEKLQNELFDAGDAFTFALDEAIAEENASPLSGATLRYPLSLLAARDIGAETDVWLIDHCYMFSTAANAFKQLRENGALRNRLARLFRIDDCDTLQGSDNAAESMKVAEHEFDGDKAARGVVQRLYRALMHVSLPIKLAVGSDDGSPARGDSLLHYVMDEVGCAIQMCAEAPAVNFGCHPFYLYGAGHSGARTYTLLWPLRDIASGEAVARRRTPPPVQFLDLGHEYWEARFQSEANPFEWLAPFAGLRDALRRCGAWQEGAVVLDAGCGNSRFAVDLADAASLDPIGAPRVAMVHGVDNSPAAIDGQIRAFPGCGDGADAAAAEGGGEAAPKRRRSNLKWSIGDLAKLDPVTFPDSSVDLVVDKGALDSMLVKPVSDIQGSESLNGATIGAKSTSTWLATSLAADAYLHEVARVLRRGGVFFLVSLGSRHNREPLLSAVRDASGQACFVIDSEELFIAECSDAASTTPGHGDNSDTTKMSQQKSWRDDYHVYVIRRC